MEVIGPFHTMDRWYHENAGPDWRAKVGQETGVDPWSVAYDELADGTSISTVFLGLNQRLFGPPDLPPEVFETMVFPDCEVCWRYSTWAEAEAGHAEVLAREMARLAELAE